MQFVVLALIALSGLIGDGWASEIRGVLWAVGVTGVLAGGVLGILGARALGPSLTPLPKPAEGASMREAGPYRLVRHPIYGGVLLAALGFALVTSPVAVPPTVVLGLVFLAKSLREEAWLAERYETYVAYRQRVRHRFLPHLW